MSWGDIGVSKRLRLSNGVSAWGTGGVPVSVPLQQTGILERLHLYTTGAETVTLGGGTAAVDVLGPWNAYNQYLLSPNQQAPIYLASGYGTALVNDLIAGLEEGQATPDIRLFAETNAAALADIYNAPTSTGTLNFYQRIPVSQLLRSVGGHIGMWPLQNPAVQLQFQFTPNSASAASAYNIYSLTANAAPFLTTGAATVTWTTPTVELWRDIWQIPLNEQDYPPFSLVNQWIEETPQGASVASATTATWQATPLSGLLARVIVFVLDGATNTGVAGSKMTQSNALQLTYDNDTPIFSESYSGAMTRQHQELGFNMPQGTFYFNLLGKDLTLARVLNTNEIGNIKVKLNFTTALGASGSAIKIIKQMITPLEVR